MNIGSWDDVDKALLLIGEVERAIAREKATAEDYIAKHKADLANRIRMPEATREELLAQVEVFVRAHEAEMDGRSMILVHGRVWLRKTSALTARSWKRVLAWLLENKKMEYVRVDHEVNKEALRGAPEKVLKACGARIKPEDAFGYELPGALPK